MSDFSADRADTAIGQTGSVGSGLVIRAIGWISAVLVFAYLANIVCTVYFELPGAFALFQADAEGGVSSIVQMLIYLAAIAGPIAFVIKTPARSLRQDAMALNGIVTYIIRGCFWAVVFIGVVDAAISFLRVEGFLDAVVGEQLSGDLGRSRFRGPFVHVPLIILGFLIAIRSKTLGFHWLGLLVVLAELLIVIGRFVFSYEQAFQGDLVRFWYGALFLFASAYTLFDDGHVRVDVLYAGFDDRTKGLVNAIGSMTLGLSVCWMVLVFGMGGKSDIINSALMTFEVSQAGFGMYVKYWMATFLAVFAVTMAIQFSSTFVEGFANYRGEPGKREPTPSGGH
ncbi:MAG: TRAP transporter small permease subunit [Marivibrio sp.]|uniref:TRAP transporter small permease subunit n=1 Tax=Marivibrio sp. TaxID=2039719 RepID=UPI0032EB764C